MKQFNDVYVENKKIDALFEEQYGNVNQFMFKNMLSLLVEIGELANETRCFKYWSKKGSSDKSIVLEEYADCMLLVLMLCNYLSISLDENFDEDNGYSDINEQFFYLFKLCSALPDNYNKKHVKLVMVNLIKLASLLGFDDDDINAACMNKINIIYTRLDVNSNY
jgi:dimeric dUTPase (all-alpha-NTP-PPase superfamily)